MPRLFRESPLNAIWEGSGNVIALDILRTIAREPAAIEAFAAEVALAGGADRRLDQAAEQMFDHLRRSIPAEAEARSVAERLALLLQASLLARRAPPAIADAFLASRLGGDGGRSFGTLAPTADVGAIVDRHAQG